LINSAQNPNLEQHIIQTLQEGDATILRNRERITKITFPLWIIPWIVGYTLAILAWIILILIFIIQDILTVLYILTTRFLCGKYQNYSLIASSSTLNSRDFPPLKWKSNTKKGLFNLNASATDLANLTDFPYGALFGGMKAQFAKEEDRILLAEKFAGDRFHEIEKTLIEKGFSPKSLKGCESLLSENIQFLHLSYTHLEIPKGTLISQLPEGMFEYHFVSLGKLDGFFSTSNTLSILARNPEFRLRYDSMTQTFQLIDIFLSFTKTNPTFVFLCGSRVEIAMKISLNLAQQALQRELVDRNWDRTSSHISLE
jgi:hypothetical protein